MSDAGQLLSRVERFRLKAVECRQLADSAQIPQMRLIYAKLALSYERLSVHEACIEEFIGPACGSLKYQRQPDDSPLKVEKHEYPNEGAEAMKAKKSYHRVARFFSGAGAAFRRRRESSQSSA